MSEIQTNTYPLEINLLQIEENVPVRESGLKSLALIALLLGGACALGWLGYDAASAASRAKAELANVETAIAKLQGSLETSASADNVSLTALLAIPDAVKLARPAATDMLDRIGSLLPRNANVASIDYADGGKAVMNARFAAMEDVVTFLREARQSGEFRNVTLTQSNASMEDGKSASPEDGIAPRSRTVEPGSPLSGKTQVGWAATIEFEYSPASAPKQGGAD